MTGPYDPARGKAVAEALAAAKRGTGPDRNGHVVDPTGPPPTDADPFDYDEHLADPYADVPPPTEQGAGEVGSGTTTIETADLAVDGAQFILDQPGGIPALWGSGSRVLWAEGEALMIAGPQGVGKTTMAGMLVRALLGIGDTDVLGLPVTDIGGRVLYLAMDRPRQIARSLGRQFDEDDRDALAKRLVVRPGPPPADLAAQPTLLVGMAEHYDAAVVFVDSLKDAAIGLATDEVGAAYNRARQHLLGTGRQSPSYTMSANAAPATTAQPRPSMPSTAAHG